MNFSIKFIPCSYEDKCLEFMINVGEYVTVNEIKQKINDYLI
jgi:hypothetical protein